MSRFRSFSALMHVGCIQAMFSHAMSESLEGVVHITDIHTAVLRQMLR